MNNIYLPQRLIDRLRGLPLAEREGIVQRAATATRINPPTKGCKMTGDWRLKVLRAICAVLFTRRERVSLEASLQAHAAACRQADDPDDPFVLSWDELRTAGRLRSSASARQSNTGRR